MIPKHLMESKLITDEQWEEYQRLKKENEKLKLNRKQLSDIKKTAICNSRLIQENKQLKDNWNKLKEHIKSEISQWCCCDNDYTRGGIEEDYSILNKMEELEKGKEE